MSVLICWNFYSYKLCQTSLQTIYFYNISGNFMRIYTIIYIIVFLHYSIFTTNGVARKNNNMCQSEYTKIFVHSDNFDNPQNLFR